MSQQVEIEARVKEIGNEIFERSQKSEFGFFNKNYWSGRMMDWSMKNPDFKVQLFRFVDVLPTLKTSQEVTEHVKAYLLKGDIELSSWIKGALGVATMGGVASKLASSSIRKNVESMAKTFICGEDSASAEPTLKNLWDSGSSFTLDILGEVVVSEEEAQHHYDKYLELIENLPGRVSSWKDNPQLEQAAWDKLPRVNVSVKCSSLYSRISNLSFEASVEGVSKRLRPLMKAAMERGAHLHLDMEQNDIRQIVLEVFERLLMEEEFRHYKHFGIVCQAYLKDSLKDLERLCSLAQNRKAPITIRLVKGAYWEYEQILAKQRDWPVPVFVGKGATDAHYERCSRFLVDHYPDLIPAFASHNVRSLAHALAYAEAKELPKNAYEIQLLYGMAVTFKTALSGMGYRVREYTPVGEMLPGMAYLVRRLLENTSNEGFLKAKFVDQARMEKLLEAPVDEETPEEKVQGFSNEALLDFSQAQVRHLSQKALEETKQKFPIEVSPVVSGDRISDLPSQEIPSPSDYSISVCKLHLASNTIADRAVEDASDAFASWSDSSMKKTRLEVVRKAAQLMRVRRYELSALMVHEVGKNFVEADGDIAEAIDFCEYYAESYESLSRPRKVGVVLGEDNTYAYKAKGVALVISPWNFPVAILCGMTVAPLLCGSPVIMKPAEESSAVAQKFYEILIEAGVPKNVVHFLPGRGEDVGAHLVAHPSTHIINFTGSRAVGMNILSSAATLAPGQKHIKKVVAELGGKNAIIVDSDADLDEAVVGCLHSAFGFQGQKCSALSRVVVVGNCYEDFKERFVKALKSMSYGRADNSDADIGPVVTKESQEKLLAVISRNQAHVVYSHELSSELEGTGNFVPATIFESKDFDGELGQQEFFGPLVCLFQVDTFEEAISRVNEVDYALTGGIFSRHPDHIAQVREKLEVGNLYINRGITGALVGRQPFGGFKLSGVGGKAGGPEYLLQFLEPFTVTENTMRRGFSPELT